MLRTVANRTTTAAKPTMFRNPFKSKKAAGAAAGPRAMSFKPTQTIYNSKPVDIPAGFLSGPPAQPIAIKRVPFASSPVPEFAPYTALTIDGVISPEECAQLLRLAEASVPDNDNADGNDNGAGAGAVADAGSAWRPALVNLGPGWEAPALDYRNSDRIIWDEQTIVDRLWARCTHAEGLEELLAGQKSTSPDGNWVFRRWNDRMRFLKYTPGQFFKAHCDGPYYYTKDNTEFRTFYTVQLYLNDSKKESSTGEGHVGGATSFLSRDEKRRVDVNPKAGSVLIFQHANLRHEGAQVTKGVKFAMRTDIIYEMVTEPAQQDA